MSETLQFCVHLCRSQPLVTIDIYMISLHNGPKRRIVHYVRSWPLAASCPNSHSGGHCLVSCHSHSSMSCCATVRLRMSRLCDSMLSKLASASLEASAMTFRGKKTRVCERCRVQRALARVWKKVRPWQRGDKFANLTFKLSYLPLLLCVHLSASFSSRVVYRPVSKLTLRWGQ